MIIQDLLLLNVPTALGHLRKTQSIFATSHQLTRVEEGFARADNEFAGNPDLLVRMLYSKVTLVYG
jgi:hypothetical protein